MANSSSHLTQYPEDPVKPPMQQQLAADAPAPGPGRHASMVAVVAAAVLLLSLELASWGGYHGSQQQQQQHPPHDTQQELHQLHNEPSPHSCALPPPLLCAHGGDASAAPPNTLEALSAALAGGATCVELDVSRTSDGRLVALHSRDLSQLLAQAAGAAAAAAGTDPASSRPAQVGDWSWEQLAALRWRGGQRVAEAAAALALLVPATEHLTLDVKVAVDEVGGGGGWQGRMAGVPSSGQDVAGWAGRHASDSQQTPQPSTRRACRALPPAAGGAGGGR